MTRDEVRAWAATLDDDARARWLTLLDALDWERARADKAETDAAAMRAFLAPGQEDDDPPRSRAGGDNALHFNGCGYFRDEDDDLPPECDCGCADALDGTAGRALLDEVAALRARVAELEARRVRACTKCSGGCDAFCSRCGAPERACMCTYDDRTLKAAPPVVACPKCGGSGAVWVVP